MFDLHMDRHWALSSNYRYDEADEGSGYNEGDVDSLDTAFKNTSDNLDLSKHQSLDFRKMAEEFFNRSGSYSELTTFILH
jgi:hypothetical protein